MKLTSIVATIVAITSVAALPATLQERQCLLNGFPCDGGSPDQGQCCSRNCQAVVCENRSTFSCQSPTGPSCIKGD
ncbi:hypothetical protein TUN199_07754 [Pyrenophora tritici-repentis]|uniref:Uncharacterized protein n=1 Tax=Pyrenophora tritici-repentis TaxID=45151 RepID=A0A5M9KT45_9PLEO|nr:hypothetical protein PtrV1_13310 [Pyrenophora tritici-repentis]KAF7446736.1 hypothetical protein A1F99_081830 [Pyrenophora tritici-repentis]KAF7569009.1 hypothetical protein PtrM4_114240 [Pyrenophora tritici-repentis]KAI0586030.1 hypothetical protein Alg215_02232 [Pyrenophora tritici-repentis]KAI0589033.1 hypothetical protein Alg130_03089 [Pyrenophora tritici-repentis]